LTVDDSSKLTHTIRDVEALCASLDDIDFDDETDEQPEQLHVPEPKSQTTHQLPPSTPSTSQDQSQSSESEHESKPSEPVNALRETSSLGSSANYYQLDQDDFHEPQRETCNYLIFLKRFNRY